MLYQRKSWGMLILSCVLFTSQIGFSQAAPGLESGTLKEQFDYMLVESNRYQNYKVVPQTWLNTFWNNVADSLQQQRADLVEARSTVSSQIEKVNELTANVQARDEQIVQLEEEKESFSFLGMNISKGTYSTMLWLLIAGLLGGLLYFFFRFKNAHVVTRSMTEKSKNLQEELERQRKLTLEKEQVLRRQLQDEINKRL